MYLDFDCKIIENGQSTYNRHNNNDMVFFTEYFCSKIMNLTGSRAYDLNLYRILYQRQPEGQVFNRS